VREVVPPLSGQEVRVDWDYYYSDHYYCYLVYYPGYYYLDYYQFYFQKNRLENRSHRSHCFQTRSRSQTVPLVRSPRLAVHSRQLDLHPLLPGPLSVHSLLPAEGGEEQDLLMRRRNKYTSLIHLGIQRGVHLHSQ